MKCENCGQEIQDDMNFCDKCGAPVVRHTPHLNNGRKKCKVCGAVIESDAAYCDHCGTPVEGNRRSNKKVIIVILSIIVILLIGAIVYLVVPKGEPSTEGETPPSSEPVVDNDYIDYTVICKDTEGNTLSSYSEQGLIGETITVTADPIDGYIARGESQSITLSENQSDNVIVFVYGKEDDATIADRVTYTVICIDDLTGKTLQEKVYEGDIDTYITCTAPEITRYYPYDEEQTLYLSEDETDNIVYFYYEEIADDYEMIIPDENILYYNEHAYYVMCSSDINSFWEAQSYCEESGGYLAIINDENENKALYDYVFNDMGYRSSYFGFTDDGSEGTWYWVGNHDLSNYTNWAKGEPDNQGNVENFALFYYNDTPYKWNDGDFGKDSDGNVYFLIEWDYSVNSTTSQE